MLYIATSIQNIAYSEIEYLLYMQFFICAYDHHSINGINARDPGSIYKYEAIG